MESADLLREPSFIVSTGEGEPRRRQKRIYTGTKGSRKNKFTFCPNRFRSDLVVRPLRSGSTDLKTAAVAALR